MSSNFEIVAVPAPAKVSLCREPPRIKKSSFVGGQMESKCPRVGTFIVALWKHYPSAEVSPSPAASLRSAAVYVPICITPEIGCVPVEMKSVQTHAGGITHPGLGMKDDTPRITLLNKQGN